MATQQHTPAPWIINAAEETITGPDGALVVYETNCNEGDARLIAAAPELLLALERTACALELAYSKKPLRDMAETLAEARAAIAKATQS